MFHYPAGTCIPNAAAAPASAAAACTRVAAGTERRFEVKCAGERLHLEEFYLHGRCEGPQVLRRRGRRLCALG